MKPVPDPNYNHARRAPEARVASPFGYAQTKLLGMGEGLDGTCQQGSAVSSLEDYK